MLHTLFLFFEYVFPNGVMNCCLSGYVQTIPDSSQPPPQALRFSHGRGEPETSDCDEPQGTMGRVQTAGEAPSRPLSPSRLPLCTHFHQKRDVWVRGRDSSSAGTKPIYRIGFCSHTRNVFRAISVTERSYAAPISKVERHIAKRFSATEQLFGHSVSK